MKEIERETVGKVVWEIGLVGAGPRGTATLERLCAHALVRPEFELRVHVIDPFEHGPGRVWRRDQPPSLLMNSAASDITIFPDTTLKTPTPIITGPNQYQWSKGIAQQSEAPFPAALRSEAEQMLPWSYASRALHGEYLRWSYLQIVAKKPSNLVLVSHRTRVLSVSRRSTGKGYNIALSTGTTIRVDAVVLAVGHYDADGGDRVSSLRKRADDLGLTYIPHGNAAEADLTAIEGGQGVVIYGMGLTFFDYVSLLTEGRGGIFRERGADDLHYLASGREPTIYAASRQGLPYRARPEFHIETLPTYQPRFFNPTFVDSILTRLDDRIPSFREHVWPELRKELAWIYYSTILRDSNTSLKRLTTIFVRQNFNVDDLVGSIDREIGGVTRHLDWQELLEPCVGMSFASSSEYSKRVEEFLAEDCRAAREGAESNPIKALAAGLRDLRGAVRKIVSHGGITGDSYANDIERWFNGLNNMLASGPPRRRIAELRALHRAGIVEFIGPASVPGLDPLRSEFVVASQAVVGSRRSAAALIEAFLPAVDICRAKDPLLVEMLKKGECRPYEISNNDGGSYRSGGLDVEESTLRIIRRSGEVHDKMYCFGPPLEGVQWVTASGARPNANSQLFVQADVIVRDLLDN